MASVSRNYLLLTPLLLAGCLGEMDPQPRYKNWRASTFYADGAGSRIAPGGTLAHEPAPVRPAVTEELVRRGQLQFGIYCLPCHGALGNGDGEVVRRGFPRPPSFHEERLRQAPDEHFESVIAHGAGRMMSYADRVHPEDRWAIVSYIRALQLSQGAKLQELPAELQARARKEMP